MCLKSSDIGANLNNEVDAHAAFFVMVLPEKCISLIVWIDLLCYLKMIFQIASKITGCLTRWSTSVTHWTCRPWFACCSRCQGRRILLYLPSLKQLYDVGNLSLTFPDISLPAPPLTRPPSRSCAWPRFTTATPSLLR